MQFLKTLTWVIVAVLLVLFASVNWNPVTVELWGGLELDIKLPVLVLGAFLLGFLPMLIVHRARLWQLRRRLEALERPAANAPVQPAPRAEPPQEERIATDTKVWP